MKVEFTQSARKHRVGRKRVLEVLALPIVVITLNDAHGRDKRLVFLGKDHSGRVLEVMAVEIVGGLLVIHAMDIRPKWRKVYEEGLK